MRIKFSASDPRAGTVAQMDSRRGQELIDSGAAEQISDNDSGTAVPQSAPVSTAQQPPPAGPEHKPAKPAKGAKA